VSPWKVILATIVIFVCGLVSGVLLVKTTNENVRPAAAVDLAPAIPQVSTSNAPAPILALTPTNSAVYTKTNVVWAPFQAQRMALIRQMVNRLHLDPDQKERISQIIKESQERNKQLWQEIAPQMREELNRVTAEIREELRPGQAKRFMDMLRESRREKNTTPGLVNPLTNAAPALDKSTNAAATAPY